MRECSILIVIGVPLFYTLDKIHRNIHKNKRIILLYTDFFKLAIMIPKLGPILLLYHKQITIFTHKSNLNDNERILNCFYEWPCNNSKLVHYILHYCEYSFFFFIFTSLAKSGITKSKENLYFF